MSGFSKVLEGGLEYKTIETSIKSERLPMGVIGLSEVHRAHYISSLCVNLGRKAVIVCQDEGSATKLCEDLNVFSSGAVVFPARDFHFRSDDVHSSEYEQRRIGVLRRILDGNYNYILCSAESASQFTIPSAELKKRSTVLTDGQDIAINDVVASLVNAGYVRCEQVEGSGQFSVRGGIVDLFAPHMSEPVRIEFWGDTIDSMSCFDVESQRRTDKVDEVKIIPAMEIIFDSNESLAQKLEAFAATVKGKGSVKAKKFINDDIDKLRGDINISCTDKYISLVYDAPATIFDYTSSDILFVEESSAVKQKFSACSKLLNEDIKAMFEEGILTKGLDKFALTWNEFISVYEKNKAVFMDNLPRGSFDVPVKELVSINAQQNAGWDGTLDYLCDDLTPSLRMGYTCVIMAGTEKSAKELAYDLETQDIKAHYFPVVPAEFPKKAVSVVAGSVSGGFEYASLKFRLFSYRKGGTATAKKQVKKRFKQGKALMSIEDISRGDYVVHAVYGIGIFDGIKTMTVDKKVKDFIKINFRGSDVLYLPVTQLDLLSKYITPRDSDKAVKLNKLGGDEWKKTKARVKSAVKDMAVQLTELYAKRINMKGYAFSPDMDMQSDFERRFEYDETDDQLESIVEIKRDMEKPYPMDRLLCGDVGFGKTEVALRAAFKCIADGKQCAFLVPTTILAFQHYQTIKKRFSGFPVEIEMLSRFRTVSERNKIKKALKRGSIDIIVGTHSIIASSVEFKDLGLLVVDEEQRFGVSQKEKLKERFPLVDVLTLSATPIPRTLNMAMSGIRDMSVLEVPPQDRHPVQTYVIAHNMEVLAEAMSREIRRGGQVYYLHNRVETIEQTAAKIHEFLPDARIGIGHGKMNEEQLSEVWRQLLEGEIDILVCTTIIETGVDVPNANTLIIEDADRLGLAQLHQIRGRVGRSSRRAFAYFTYNDKKQLSDVAQRRLSAIREFTQFGSGFQIAMRDLEIRGAGNILGAQQHGHMEAVGYDMYLQLLSQAVEDQKSAESDRPHEEEKECLIDLAIDAHIPENYIDSVKNRIGMYKRIASIRNEEDAMDVMDELIDRFGEPPECVKGLIDVALIRSRASNVDIYEIAQRNGMLLIYMNDIKPIHISLLSKFFRGRVMISAVKSKQFVSVKLLNQNSIHVLGEVIKVFEMAKDNA
ncbi:MAG: transcription-repair coupling factor [Faecalibacterium sp.]|nr:transcription-repair coupling factor [Ruminococcus sp.]MCM1391456.1 transcription-repair coupling factor [Ruminococcus sp.]MCM1485229.1 transcription-repair coupling factor [Faecalibacterium sp.]